MPWHNLHPGAWTDWRYWWDGVSYVITGRRVPARRRTETFRHAQVNSFRYLARSEMALRAWRAGITVAA